MTTSLPNYPNRTTLNRHKRGKPKLGLLKRLARRALRAVIPVLMIVAVIGLAWLVHQFGLI